jgi:hypothetical protein
LLRIGSHLKVLLNSELAVQQTGLGVSFTHEKNETQINGSKTSSRIFVQKNFFDFIESAQENFKKE